MLKRSNILKTLCILVGICFTQIAYSQKDTEFWFVAPAVTKNHCSVNCPGAAPTSFVFTTYELPATITISIPTNDISINPISGFTPVVLNIPANTTFRYELWGENFEDPGFENELQNRKNIENWLDPADPTQPTNRGIHIESSSFISAYYVVEEMNNSDILALKGSNALGDEFYVPFQTNQENVNYSPEQAYSAIDIVAVDAGTTEIVIYPPKDAGGVNPKQVLGYNNQLSAVQDSIVIFLEQGETMSIVPGYIDGNGDYIYNRQPEDRLNGTYIKVKGGKRVAVTTKDDSVRGDSGCWDYISDQMIPIEALDLNGERSQLVGAEYIVMKGNLAGTNRNPARPDYDRIYILATEDNTNITVTDITLGGSVTYNNVSAGEQVTYTLDENTSVVYVNTGDINKPVYVFHVTGAGSGCEIGGAVLPSVSLCTGSFQVGFVRDNPQGVKEYFLNVLGRTNALDSFRLNGVLTGWEESDFTQIPGTDWWAGQFDMETEIDPLEPYLLTNNVDIFHLGALHGGRTNGGNYGYFSNYNAIEAISFIEGNTTQQSIKLCFGNSAQLIVDGGLYYTWDPGTYLDDSTIAMPIVSPLENIKYEIVAFGATCAPPDTTYLEVIVSDPLQANFSVSTNQGCSPLVVDIDNESFGNKTNKWTIESADSSFIYSISEEPGSYTFVNNTDTIQDYQIILLVKDRKKICTRTFFRNIKVFPSITAGLDVDTAVGCQPFSVSFTDTSSGNLQNFYWEYGDGGGSLDTVSNYNFSEEHTYTNITLKDTNFTASLIVESPYLCRDTAQVELTVHPFISAEFGVDTVAECSPFVVGLQNGSIGVDQYDLDFGDGSDTSFLAFDNLFHTFINNDSVERVDTIILIGENNAGCQDTASRMITIYPEVTSSFTLSDRSICDSVLVSTTNQSIGENVTYFWDFGDGSSSIAEEPSHLFRNTSSNDTNYIISLNVVSPFCSHISYDTLQVFPFNSAGFTFDIVERCTPMILEFNPTNATGDSLLWDFNGDQIIDSITYNKDIFYKTFNNEDTSGVINTSIQLISPMVGCNDTLTRLLDIPAEVVSQITDVSTFVGCSPVAVDMSSESLGGDLNYFWDFDNGMSSSDSVAGEQIFENKTGFDLDFSVKLIATNPRTGCSDVDSIIVRVYPYVEASFTTVFDQVCAPTIATFFNTSTKNDEEQYVWEMNNEFSDSDSTFTYTFENNNVSDSIVFPIEMRAYLASHPQCEDFAYDTLTVYPQVKAIMDVDTLAGCNPLPVTFTNLSTGNSLEIDWDFGSGQGSVLDEVTQTFENFDSAALVQEVVLSVRDVNGCVHDTSINITVYPFIEADFSVFDANGCSPFTIEMNNFSSEGMADYTWVFGDGDTVLFDTASHMYVNNMDTVATYDLKLITNNAEGCADTAIEVIEVYPEVLPGFEGEFEGCHPVEIAFNNITENGDNFIWDFGDGGFSSDTSPVHLYQNFSWEEDLEFEVNLRATSIYNCVGELDTIVNVFATPLASFESESMMDCSPVEVEFTNQSFGTNLTNYWSIDTVLVDSTEHFSNEFANPDSVIQSFDIQLISVTENGCKDTTMRTIRVMPEVTSNFTMSVDSGCHALDVAFENASLNANYFEWSFGDGSSSILEDPDRSFLNTTNKDTTYQVILTSYSVYECFHSDTQYVTVFPTPEAEFEFDPPLQQFEEFPEVTFTNYSSYLNTWDFEWQFGDDSISNSSAEEFVKEYMIWGDINNNSEIDIQLLAVNPLHTQCYDSVIHTIRILPPTPEIQIIAADVEGCEPLSINFSTESKYADENEFSWQFDDGQFGSGTEVSHLFEESGIYNVRVEVNGDGGTSYDFMTVTVYNKPEVYFEFFPDTVMLAGDGEEEDPIQFYNQTIDGNTWKWDFGVQSLENDVSVDKEPNYIYRNVDFEQVPYEREVKLVATSTEGCKDSLTRIVIVEAAGVVKFPNAFTPNLVGPSDDGSYRDINDFSIFHPFSEGVSEYHLEIYTRWGEIIFATDDITVGWDGYYKKKLVSQGVYVWKVWGKYTNRRQFIKWGNVTVLHNRDSSR